MMRSVDLFPDPITAAAPRGKGRRGRGTRGCSAEDEFAFQCRAMRLPEFAREHRFAKSIGRQWRFDFAFIEHMLAVELEGVVFAMATIGGKRRMVSMGRHAHADGFREDCRKYAAAAQLGWTVIRFETQMVKSGEAIQATMRVLAARGWSGPQAGADPLADPDFNDAIDFIGGS